MTATFSALPQIYTAILTSLRADAALATLGVTVFDTMPERPAYPYIIFDDPFETPNRTFGQNGHDCTVTLSIYCQTPATTTAGTGKAGFLLGLQIAERVCALLTDIEGAPLVVADHDVVDADVLGVEGFREIDGKTRRVDVTITLMLETQP